MNSTMRSMRRPPALPPIVGFTGRAGAGKDTAAQYLHFNHGYATLRFSDPLKNGLAAMFGLPAGVWEDREAKEKPLPWLGVSPRRLAQTLGHDWGRKMIHPDVWVRAMERRIQEIPTRRVVVPDVRYDNEAALLGRMGGVVIELRRASLAPVERHASESGIDPNLTAAVVQNDGNDPVQLWLDVERVLLRLKEQP